MVKVEHKQTRVIVTFTGDVTEASIIELVNEIDRMKIDFFYRQVDLHIASHGGETTALEYFIEAISHWRQQDLTVTTRALISCKSAAAIMLSLGDHREASSSSRLHYHDSRMSLNQHSVVTSDSAEVVSEVLKGIDNRMLESLVDRVVEDDIFASSMQVAALEDRDKAILGNIRMEWSRSTNEESDDEDDETWLNIWLKKTQETNNEQVLHARWFKLYEALLNQDQPISATFAIKLGLVDRLVEPTAEKWGDPTLGSDARWIAIPEWRTAYPYGRMDERHLRRHMLILGETGSGKTKSAILPVLAAAYRSPRVGVGLVIDPKSELDDVLDEWSKGNGREKYKHLVRITASDIALNLMSGDVWSIKGMIENNEYWGVAQRILQRVATLTDSNPARILLGEPTPGRDPYWYQEGTALATTIVAVAVEFLIHPENYIECDESGEKDRMRSVVRNRLSAIGAKAGLFMNRWKKYVKDAEDGVDHEDASPIGAYSFDDEDGRYKGQAELPCEDTLRRDCVISKLMMNLKHLGLSAVVEEALDSIGKEWKDSEMSRTDFDTIIGRIRSAISSESEVRKPLNVLAITSMICDEFFSIVETYGETRNGRMVSSDEPDYTPLHALADIVAERKEHQNELVAKQIRRYADMRKSARAQYSGVQSAATITWNEIASPKMNKTIYFGCEMQNPGNSTEAELDFLDFAKDIAKNQQDIDIEPGTFYIYQPDRHGLDNLVAKACKILFFESVLDNEERARNGEGMPLAAYIADEFQRFITADRVHGEQSFLDVCRSFGAFTVIACQSIASLHYALAAIEGDDSKRKSAIDIICNNTATKMFFRTTDKDTADRLDTICPAMTGGDLVTKIRPLSTLAAGECYASFPDGRFERIQLEAFGSSE